MPTYGYECAACKKQFEVFQRITEDPLKTHEGCGGELRRLLYPVGIVFKGPGFYINDYARKNGNGAAKPGEGKSESAPQTASDSKSEAKPEAKSEVKSETKTESAASSTASAE